MPPARARTTQDEPSKPTANSTTKSKKLAQNSSSNAVKDDGIPNGSAAGSVVSAHTAAPNIPWNSEQTSTLHDYRQAYKLDTPASFSTNLSHAVLQSGIGKYSPSMSRNRAKRKAGKEQLAMAVRKHFNNLAVSESDVIVDFVYKVKHEDQAFKIRFGPKNK